MKLSLLWLWKNKAFKATASPDEILKRWKLSKFETLYRQSWLFRWQLNEAETHYLTRLCGPVEGNPQNGLIAQGLPPPQSFSRFDWIRDLRDYGGSRKNDSRALILRWLDDYKIGPCAVAA